VEKAMSERAVDGLNERELACLAHLEEAKKLGLNFSRYCREKHLSFHQWAWIKRVLVRKGVISERRQAEASKVASFVSVRVAAPVAATATATATVCRIRHPCGWMIECSSYPDASWVLALMSGAAA
jgi:hypothetical protein